MRAMMTIGCALSLVYFLAWSCGNEKDKKLPIGDNLSGVKFLKKVTGSDDLFFLVNTNNYKIYQTGSIQLRSRKDSQKVIATRTIPSLATSVTHFEGENDVHYLAVTFEPESSEKNPEVLFIPYLLEDDKKSVKFQKTRPQFTLSRSSSDTFAENIKVKSVIPISATYKEIEGGRPRLAISCNGGELFVMDLKGEPSKWKAPVHVRNYGNLATREAIMITDDDVLLLFPAFSDVSKKQQLSTGHDKKMEKSPGKPSPKSEMSRANVLKELTSPYQLTLYDMREETLSFKPYKTVYEKESVWLDISLDGESTSVNDGYFRTNFGRALKSPRAGEKNTFYLSQRSSSPNTEAKSQILKLEVSANLRNTWEDDTKGEVDLLLELTFAPKPVFKVVDEKTGGSSFSKDPRIYSLYDFVMTNSKKNDEDAQFLAISYNYRKKFYFLLLGDKGSVSRKYEKRPMKESYWALAFWEDEKRYVTVKNAYKKEAELVSSKL